VFFGPDPEVWNLQ